MTELRAGLRLLTNNMIIIEIITVFLACSKISYREGANDVKLKASLQNYCSQREGANDVMSKK